MAELWCNQEARAKDKLEMMLEPNLDVRGFLETAYLHPAIKAALAVDSPTLGKGGIHNLLESRRSQTTPIAPFQSKSLHDTPRNQDCNSIVSQSVLLVPKSRWRCRRVIAGSTLGVATGDSHVGLSVALVNVDTTRGNILPKNNQFCVERDNTLQYSAPIYGTVRSDPCNKSSWWTTW